MVSLILLLKLGSSQSTKMNQNDQKGESIRSSTWNNFMILNGINTYNSVLNGTCISQFWDFEHANNRCHFQDEARLTTLPNRVAHRVAHRKKRRWPFGDIPICWKTDLKLDVVGCLIHTSTYIYIYIMHTYIYICVHIQIISYHYCDHNV